MALESYIRLKGRTSYFRRKIPADLVIRLASTEICFKLGVIDRDSALAIGRRLAVEVDVFFVSARRNEMLSSSDLSRILAAALQDWQAVVAPVPHPLRKMRDQAKDLAQSADGLLRQQSEGYDVIDPDYLMEKCGTAGVAVPTDPAAMRMAANAMAAGMASHYLMTAATLARDHNLVRGVFKLPADVWEARAERLLLPFGVSSDQVAEQAEEIRVRSRPAPALNPVSAASGNQASNALGSQSKFEREGGTSFSTQAHYIVNERIKVKEVGKDAVQNLAPSLKLWLQICGDADIREYTIRHMDEFRGTLLDIPKVYWRSKAEQAKGILAVIAEVQAKSLDYDRISNKTINKHLSNLNSIFEYAKKTGVLDRTLPNFADGLYLDTGVAATGLEPHEERPGYTRDQVATFFKHPVYTGRKSAYFYNHSGDVIVRDALYWLPLLAAFQLMRREEICQLRVKHVKQLGDIWYFDLMPLDIKVKRATSKRRVPLHHAIIALGFVKEVVVGRDPEELLFPELVKNSKGSYSDYVGKRVSRMVDSLGIKLIRVDSSEADGALHPFRHHGITQLENRHEVKDGIVDALSGHSSRERESERKRYTDEIYMSVLRDTINLLDLPVDIETLNRKWRKSRLTE